MEINFEFGIQEIVYVKPEDITNRPSLHGSLPAYKVVSRIYEELNENGGVTSYVVRHIDSTTPGGGKLYKFTQDELMSKDSYNALIAIIHANKHIPKNEAANVYYSPQISGTHTTTSGTAISSSPW